MRYPLSRNGLESKLPTRSRLRVRGEHSRSASWRSGVLSLGILLLGLSAADSRATEYGRAVTVSATIAQGASRPAYTVGQNFVLVVVNSAAWGASSCRQDAVAIKKEDSHLLAQLLTALQTGKPITLYVDDTLRPIDAVICQVTVIQVAEP